jgi:uncharacterized membrane protein
MFTVLFYLAVVILIAATLAAAIVILMGRDEIQRHGFLGVAYCNPKDPRCSVVRPNNEGGGTTMNLRYKSVVIALIFAFIVCVPYIVIFEHSSLGR